MAALTFGTLQTEVFDQSGLDSTDTGNQTRVQRWLNLVQQDICARWPWNFLRSRENIVTVVDVTGNAGVNNGSTAITDNSFLTSAASVGLYIQFATANDWYKITAFGSPNFITLEQPYLGTSALVVNYTIRKFFYSLSSNCDRICDIRNWNTPLKLDELFPRDVDSIDPNPQSTNTSYGFFPYGYDSSGNVQICPYPFPSDARLFEIRTFKRPTDMSSSGDLPTLPNKWAHIIAFGACAMAFAYLRKPEFVTIWERKFEAKILDMMAQERTSEDLSPVLQSIDSGNKTENWLQMPGQYPVVQGHP